jgi:RNA polymerase sigma-70 factor (ECF subfamily)
MKKKAKLTKVEEVDLIDRAKLGDMAALNRIFTDNMDTFSKAVGKYLYNAEEKNDMLSYIFEKVIKNIHKYRAHDNFQGWIATLSKNAAIDYLRHKKIVVNRELRTDNFAPEMLDHMSALTDYAPSAEDTIIAKEYSDMLYRELDKLPDEYKTIVELKADGKTIKEISTHVGISESAVKVRFAKATKTLRIALANVA